MSRRPLAHPVERLAKAQSRMAPGGLLWSESPIPRRYSPRVPMAGEDPPPPPETVILPETQGSANCVDLTPPEADTGNTWTWGPQNGESKFYTVPTWPANPATRLPRDRPYISFGTRMVGTAGAWSLRFRCTSHAPGLSFVQFYAESSGGPFVDVNQGSVWRPYLGGPGTGNVNALNAATGMELVQVTAAGLTVGVVQDVPVDGFFLELFAAGSRKVVKFQGYVSGVGPTAAVTIDSFAFVQGG